MSNTPVDRDKTFFKCPVCGKMVSASGFEYHRMKEIEEEKRLKDENQR